MLIVNQDRDNQVVYNPQQDDLMVIPVGYNKILFGFNVYVKGESVGTFDTEVEALREVENIINCKNEIYIVNGYEAWNTWEEIKEVMSHE